MAELILAIPGLAGSGIATFAGTTFGAAALNLAGGLALNALSSALMGGGRRADDQARQLQLPTSLPLYRFPYGTTEAAGTPAPAYLVQDDVLYGCWLLSSRPAALTSFTLLLDKRPVSYTGNPLDFAGSGGAASNAPFDGYVNFWVGRGDQTAPPADILAEVPYDAGSLPDGFKPTEAWRGRTVVWMRLRLGSNNGERWPAWPPAVSMVGDWSLVWDPRDEEQSLDDPSTWAWSDNHGLCLLDALTQHPVAPHDPDDLFIATFSWAADAAAQAVALKAGGTEPRYRVGGTVVFEDGAELEDHIDDIVSAGGGTLIRASGRLGYAPGIWHAPVATVTDRIGGFERAVLAEDEAWTHIRTFYTSAARGYETAEFGEWPIPGATGIRRVMEQQLPMVTSPTQAQRLRQIAGRLALRQKTLSFVGFPGELFDPLPGANVTVDWARPTRANGVYMLASSRPAEQLGPDGDGLVLRVPVTLRETAEEVYAWTPASDEEDVDDEAFDAAFTGISAPGAISTTTGASVDLDTGGTILPRVLFQFDPSVTGRVRQYEWEYENPSSAGAWLPGGVLGADLRNAGGKVFGYLVGLAPALSTRIRVRAVGDGGLVSDWVTSATVALDFDLVLNSATAGPGTGEATLNVTTPETALFAGVIVYRAATGAGFGAAVAVSGVLAIDPDTTGDVVATGITAGEADFWVVPVTLTGGEGTADGPETLTIT